MGMITFWDAFTVILWWVLWIFYGSACIGLFMLGFVFLEDAKETWEVIIGLVFWALGIPATAAVLAWAYWALEYKGMR